MSAQDLEIHLLELPKFKRTLEALDEPPDQTLDQLRTLLAAI